MYGMWCRLLRPYPSTCLSPAATKMLIASKLTCHSLLISPKNKNNFGTAASNFKLATLPELPYAPSALEPVISGQIMALHHGKHHAAYVTNYNKAIEQLAEAQHQGNIAKIIELQGAINFNGGGHLNHSIFWKNLAPQKDGGGAPPSGPLAQAIAKKWGSLDKFIEAFNTSTAAVQGSGWGWLVAKKGSQDLDIITTPNQNPIVGNLVPILGVDVWEHAYYLDYKNARPDYLKAIWKVINWKDVAQRYDSAK